DLLPPKADGARAHRKEAHGRLQRRRLPSAVAPDQAHGFALVHGQRDPAQHVRGATIGVDRDELEQPGAHVVPSVPMSVVVTRSLRLISSGVPSARIAPWCMATMRSE